MEFIAHRGASHEAPENTLAAVKLGWEQAADAVEVDVHLTRDGRLVVIHDADTRKITGVRRRVREHTLEQLQTLEVGAWKHSRWTGERIPTLDDALATMPPRKRFFVEIKGGPVSVKEFAAVVGRCGKAPEQIVPIGFDRETMRQVKRALPQLEVCWVVEFKRSWRTGRWLPTPEKLIEHAREAGLDGVDLSARGPWSAPLVAQLKAAGLSVYVWTVDSPALARKLRAAGVDGITTNRPGWMREQLKPK